MIGRFCVRGDEDIDGGRPGRTVPVGQRREALEQFVLDVIQGRRTGKRASLVLGLLYGLSKIYQFGVQARLFLYDKRMLRDHTLGCLVVSVGNLTVGGTGKTPVVETFARALRSEGRRVAILSRGYKSAKRPVWERVRDHLMLREGTLPPKIVSDGSRLLLDSERAGDEPHMLASNLQDVVVLVHKDRVRSGRYAIENYNSDTLLLDDGFQYLALRPHLHLVLVDATKPFGNGHVLPRGVLREPVSNIDRADVVLLTKCNGTGHEALKERMRRHNPDVEIIESAHKPRYYADVYTRERIPLERLEGEKIAAISGIAGPDGFEETLRHLKADVVLTRRFADHHRYTQQEIIDFINSSREAGARWIVTTEKDAVRFPKIDRRDVPIVFLRVEIEILSGAEDFHDCVARLCFR